MNKRFSGADLARPAYRRARIFYLLCLFIPLEVAWNLGDFLSAELGAPLWPLVWVRGIATQWILAALSVGLAVSALSSARSFGILARVSVSLTLFFLLALEGSQGKILHSGHLCLWISFVFLWLPPPSPRRSTQLQARLVVAWASALVFLVYSTAGLNKLAVSFLRWPGWFSDSAVSDAMALHALSGGAASVPMFPPAWGLVLAFGYFVCLVPSLGVAFVPGGSRLWMFGLICFHLLNAGLMHIYFTMNVFLLILFGSSRDPLRLLRWRRRRRRRGESFQREPACP